MWTVTANHEQNLILIKSDETLDYDSLNSVLRQVYIENGDRYSSYNRFADLSDVKNFAIDLDTCLEIIRSHRSYNPPDEVKLSLYFPFPAKNIVGAQSQLFNLMAELEGIDIHISRSLDDCADYLSVNRELLVI